MPNSPCKVIAVTKRLVIRYHMTDDLDALYELYESWGDVPGVEPLNPDRFEEYANLKGYIEYMYGFYGTGMFSVCLKNSGKLIGRCGAWPSEVGGEWMLEVGYMIHKDFSGQGYAVEAMTAIREYLRTETDFEKAGACILKDNVASRAVAVSIGMTYSGAGNDQMDIYTMDIT